MTNVQVVCCMIFGVILLVVVGVNKSSEDHHRNMLQRIEMCSKIPADRLPHIPECSGNKDK